MRRLNLLDVLIVAAVIGLLLFLGSKDFPRYAQRTLRPPAPADAPKKG
jgi:hypothetical protein